MRADVGGEDRPRHVGETARKERRGHLHDVVLRLEPGEVMRFLFAADFAEADESLHPVRIAMHGFGHGDRLRDVRIGRSVQEIMMAA